MLEKETAESGGQNGFSRLTAYWMSLFSGLFLIAVILLLLVNFNNLRQSDPMTSLNSQKLNALVAKHRLNPGDESVKKEIQSLDQRIRQDYVNSQTTARRGVYLLIAVFAIFILSLKKSLVFSIVPGSGREPLHIGYSRIALAGIAVILMIVAFAMNFIGKN
jgi:uncharacterized integral membrane protein